MTVEKEDVSHKLVSSTILFAASQWVVKILGLAGMVILARLLLPEDYGIVASASLVSMLLTTMSEMGTLQYLTRKQQVSDIDMHNAWSIRFVQYSAVSILLVLSAGSIANFFGSEEIKFAVYVLAFISFISAFENIGYYIDQRKLDYRSTALMDIYSKIISLVFTVAAAYILRNYYALLAGAMSGALSKLLLTYHFSHYRPRFSLKGASKQWSFSQWMLITNFAIYTRNKVDQWFIGSYSGTTALGYYNMADSMTRMSVGQLSWPIVNSSYSALAGVNNEMSKFRYLFSQLIGITFYVSVPVIVFLFYYWVPVIDVVLGDHWTALHSFGFLFLFSVLAWPLVQLNHNAMIILGYEKMGAYFGWGQAIFLAPVLYFAINLDLFNFLLVKLGSIFIFLIAYSLWSRKILGIGVSIYLRRSYRIIILSLLALSSTLFFSFPKDLFDLIWLSLCYGLSFLLLIFIIQRSNVFRCDVEDYLVKNIMLRLKPFFHLG